MDAKELAAFIIKAIRDDDASCFVDQRGKLTHLKGNVDFEAVAKRVLEKVGGQIHQIGSTKEGTEVESD
jgi:hypothetical protein